MLPLSPDLGDSSGHEEEEVDIFEFPREQLRIVDDFGESHFGEVQLCEVQLYPVHVEVNACNLVVVSTLRHEPARSEFVRDVRALAKLNDVNIAKLLGACMDSEPVCAIREYTEFGDLCQFLQDHVAETTTPRPANANTLRFVLNYFHVIDAAIKQGCLLFSCSHLSCSSLVFSYGCLIYMATQIASGMKYLESTNFVHKDLATR